MDNRRPYDRFGTSQNRMRYDQNRFNDRNSNSMSEDRMNDDYDYDYDYAANRYDDYNRSGWSAGDRRMRHPAGDDPAWSLNSNRETWDRDRSPSRFGADSSFGSPNRSQHHHESFMDQVKDSVKSFFGKGPKGYKRSDERIREDVNEALYRDHRIDASDIEVTVKDTVVTLMGTVEERQMKRLAEDVAENCSGVTDVINQLRVSPNPNMGLQTETQTSATMATSGSKSKSIQ